MGINERKEREKEERRRVILQAAKKLIARHGVDGMSMNQLAESTELNKATLYLYYSNKADLVDAIVFEALVQLETLLQEAVSRPLSGIDRIMRIADIMFQFYREYPVYFYTMNHQENRNAAERLETPYAEKGNAKAAALFQILAKCIGQGIEEGSIRADIDIQIFLMLFFAHIYGVMHTIYSKADVYEDVLNLEAESIEKAAREMVVHYLQNPIAG